ncbi:iron ABC transporter permease [Dactylosporangium fulvum]|uniref:Iron ABC transporter permease n=1 Tax=Dactylosporangium fulvum TaxID=53359 RepID=A0ABY5WE17_9ACTN|nr:iron ABC transporter permease [Dactylosporangium fulvum]UWP86981.1 iron ABC transporter permease [Dactylosporangium fulvum]
MTTDPRRRVAILAGAVGLLLAAAVAGVSVGARHVPPAEVWRALVAYAGTDEHLIVRDIRLPRTVLGICVGAALGCAGALVQTLTRNPLAEPGLLGVTAGAAFALNVGVFAGWTATQAGQLGLAVAGSCLAAVAVYAVGRTSPLRLVLAGMALSAVLLGISLGLRLTFPDVLDAYRFWSVGALAGTERTPLAGPVLVVVVALVGSVVVAGPLGALALGEDVAHTLGAHVSRTRVAVLALVTVLTGVATAVAGPVSFVGLMVPHLARRLAGGSTRWLVAYAVLLGPVLLLIADVSARLLLPTGEVPVAVVTAFLGGPALIWVVRRYGAAAL